MTWKSFPLAVEVVRELSCIIVGAGRRVLSRRPVDNQYLIGIELTVCLIAWAVPLSFSFEVAVSETWDGVIATIVSVTFVMVGSVGGASGRMVVADGGLIDSDELKNQSQVTWSHPATRTFAYHQRQAFCIFLLTARR
jgi:hypothetical protein